MNSLVSKLVEMTREAESMAERLRSLSADLQRRTRDLALLDNATTLLLLCETVEEVGARVSQVAVAIFPRSHGHLLLLRPQDSAMEISAVWGGRADDALPRSFRPEDCWGYRHGVAHLVLNPTADFLCTHIAPSITNPYVCAPILARGQVLGVLHIEFPPLEEATTPNHSWNGGPLANECAMVEAIASQVGVTLSHLNLRDSLHTQSIRDPLTGLYNRRYLEDAFIRVQAHADRHKSTFNIVAIDIDRFKRVNDVFGHAAGDALLKAVSNLLVSLVRGEDIVCRFGGEEFVLVMPGIPFENALERAEIIRKKIEGLTIEHQNQALDSITASFGVAAFPAHARRWSSVLEEADAALYRAKQEGRNVVRAAVIRS